MWREGLFGVILGNVYEKFGTFNQLVKESDCIVGPVCEFEFHSYDDITKGAWMKIEIPHIVKNPKCGRQDQSTYLGTDI